MALPDAFPEHLVEIRHAFIPYGRRNLRNIAESLSQKFLGGFDAAVIDIFADGKPRYFFENAAEVIPADKKLPAKLADG